jgi:uncharacterized membrane protein
VAVTTFPLAAAGPVLAHASGFSWDEGLLVMAPLVVIGALLWLANRRAARLGQDGAERGDIPGDGTAGRDSTAGDGGTRTG